METGPATVLAGNPVSYTITLTNNGPGPATGVVLNDALTFVPPSGVFVPGSFTITPAAGNPDTFTLTTLPFGFIETANAPIASGHVDTFTVMGGTLASAPNNSTVSDTASVTSTTTDPNPGNNSATVTTTVTQLPPVVTPPANQMAAEGASASFSLGSFTDANAMATSWTVDVKWGDGTPDTMFTTTTKGSLGSSPHTYAEEGTYTATVTVTSNVNASGSANFMVAVSDPAVVGTTLAVNATAGAPVFNKAVANFTDPGGAEPNPSDPAGTINNHYAIVNINWGDGTPLDTTTGKLSFSGSPGSKTDKFTVSGNHTYAASGTYTITVALNHEGVLSTATSTAAVSSLGLFFQGAQTRTSGFWNDQLGQELLRKLTKTNGNTGQTLGQWLAGTFPKLYGAGSPNNLSTFSNAQVGTYYRVLFNMFNTNMLDAEVLSLALYIYATTSSLGGTAGTMYNLQVDANGLGAYLFNIGGHGAAFGVPNGTVLDIFQIMLAANNSAVGGEPWGSNLSLRNDGLAIFRLLNGDGQTP
jgi:uncharacterized repeat protein (TIGR01451 family)